uniref:Homing endonuclease LAGLIDADG domain-containing protein n=1 Tax=Pseudopediastrum boryanum TaxID=55410 RepID=A0A2U8GKC3_PSEBY|nr:hypothetical protein [Pseudopediastrum boryanum]AWI68711.1 hypothetical protein [Pseudopediastrum boryanum]
MKYCFKYRKGTIVGLFDSDGTYAARITKRQQNKIGLALSCTLTQKTANEDVLGILKDQLESTVKINSGDLSKKKSHSSFTVSFDTVPGKKIMKILKSFPPLSPGKRKDYLIGIKLLEYSKKRCFAELETNNLYSSEEKEKISAISAGMLVYNMSNNVSSIVKQSKKKEKTLKDWLIYMKVDPVFKKLGFDLGKKILTSIQKTVNNLKNSLINGKQIPKDYIVGFHIGDGCLGVGVTFTRGNQLMEVSPYWYLDEVKGSSAVLHAIKATLKVGNVGKHTHGKHTHGKHTHGKHTHGKHTHGKHTHGHGKHTHGKHTHGKHTHGKHTHADDKLQVTGWKSCFPIIQVLGKYNLPKSRQEQFNKFLKCYYICGQGLHYGPKGFQTFLDISYTMNLEGRLKRRPKKEIEQSFAEYLAYRKTQPFSLKTRARRLRKDFRKRFESS